MAEKEKRANVYLREEDRSVNVNITGDAKPSINDEILDKWQNIINTTAKIFNVPAGLIMKITPETMEVVLSSKTENNPYEPEANDSLGHGLYCETVIGRNDMLMVEDSLSNKYWKNNPDVKLNMISYLGLPIQWPDGETFGTICVLDSQKRTFNSEYRDLLKQFKTILEDDLERELRNKDQRQAGTLTELRLKEIHHRLKNEFSILSSIVQLKAMESQEDTRQTLDEIYGKIKSIALLHAKIYESNDFTTTIEEYIEDIINASISVFDESISVSIISKTKMEFQTKHLFEFGIVFSELATNSVKHGMPVEGGSITVEFDSVSDGNSKRYKILYQDNGKGYSDKYLKGEGRRGTGSVIIQNFIDTFGGEIHRYNKDGAVTEFVFEKSAS